MNETRPPERSSSLDWIAGELQEWRRLERLRQLRIRESPHVGGLIQWEGRAYLDFGSNDYLGIAADGKLVDAVRRAAGEHGWGSGASPLVSGYGVLHRRLEEELAALEGVQAVALFPTGFAANLAAVGCLVGTGDVVYSDQLNHASIVDGCRLSRAEVRIFRHLDLQQLEGMMADRSQFRRALVVTDSLFSMDGDFAPLPELGALARKHDCMLMVDEAHATGVWGEQGRGVTEWQAAEAVVDVRVGTLSKAVGSIGGFVAGSQDLIDWIRNRGRSYMFSTALPEAAAAASLAAIRIIRDEPQRRQQLQQVIHWFAEGVRENAASGLCRRLAPGLEASGTAALSQIIPVVVGDERQALTAARLLREQGLFVPAIRPPAVPAGQCRLRISLSSSHTRPQIDRLVEALAGLDCSEET